MDNELEEEKEDESRKKHLEEQRLKEEERNNIIKETKRRLKSDKAIKEYFKQFKESSVKHFIDRYANYKGMYMEFGQKFGEFLENQNLKNYEDTLNCLKQIQLKKLYDLRRQWGANLVKLEGVSISWDFDNWSEDIFNCPFLSPISREEFDLYYQYALSIDFVLDENNNFSFCCDLTEIDEDHVFPEWFNYHNTYTDASKYLLLPDIRGQKEDYYRSICFRKKEEEMKKQGIEAPKYVQDERPEIKPYIFKDVETFVKLFEDDKSKKLFYNFENYSPSLDRNPDSDDKYLTQKAEELVMGLVDLQFTLPIEAHLDWRVAIINMWEKYERDNVIKALPLLFEDYRFRVENNIQIETIEEKHKSDLSESVKEQVLKGRELCGEPQNFDY